MNKISILISLFVFCGCVNYNVTLYSPDGKSTTKCKLATGQDEGGVCWHGYSCTPQDASQGCWTEISLQ